MLIINSAYLYQKYLGTAFSQKALTEFTTYYPYNKIGALMKGLIEKECIEECEVINKHKYYRLTPKGIDIAEHISEGYEECLINFCNKYGVIL
jgi:hypothetical protein